MVQTATGLILTPSLTQDRVSIDLHFEPSVGILARKVDKLGADIRSFREPLKRIVQQVMIPSIRRNFDAGGRPKWEPLSDQTVKRRGGSDTPLVRTGALRRQMGYINTWTIDNEKAMITDLPEAVWYGKVHQAGASFSVGGGAFKTVHVSYLGKTLGQADSNAGDRGEIPARPFVVLQKMDIIKANKVMREWVAERVRMAGL